MTDILDEKRKNLKSYGNFNSRMLLKPKSRIAITKDINHLTTY